VGFEGFVVGSDISVEYLEDRLTGFEGKNWES
jgi:hypothetical protein